MRQAGLAVESTRAAPRPRRQDEFLLRECSLPKSTLSKPRVSKMTNPSLRRRASGGPLGAEQFRLLQHSLRGLLLFVRRIAVFAEDALHRDADFRADGFALKPVNG